VAKCLYINAAGVALCITAVNIARSQIGGFIRWIVRSVVLIVNVGWIICLNVVDVRKLFIVIQSAKLDIGRNIK